ncbi:hypothetical protein B0T26DRAFT_197267 [Lasiosphaeria miniovina]|uniref:Uncharacterized protein n=1 Tax=Lasiosphaeria miniovina TaxID=1954250 RepID=A0AA40ATY7_9PEZI|nr:uncharacterized protein B0T26DRAFT_197267 [Lasiosphaeria miniovina]KAK0721975.1 hypothetical protein B0T26DRAFT_197267 [Lasiosphaeria miniovina]
MDVSCRHEAHQSDTGALVPFLGPYFMQVQAHPPGSWAARAQEVEVPRLRWPIGLNLGIPGSCAGAVHTWATQRNLL